MSKCPLCDGTGEIDDGSEEDLCLGEQDPCVGWFEAHYEELHRDYKGKWIAINGQQGVVASDRDLKVVHDEVVRLGVRNTALFHFINP